MTGVRARRVLVRGRVQGVGFRWSTRAAARRLDVRGWVQNLSDGSVEVHAEGDENAVDALERWLRAGPDGARVDELDVRAAEHGGATDFEIRR